jgi:DNA-binding MarR family transcriptional regulator/GNAT superfamily N-acetyltransferase
MERAMVERVRSFNRAVGERIGALEGRFPGRERPMGASRVLWEIGPDGRDVAELRSGLVLDSGYLARLLRSLERERLVVVEPGPGDGRRRRARLTGAGAAERAELDRRSDELAAAVLAPLDEAERARLTGAMAEVERLLTAASVVVEAEDPAGPDARRCLDAYAAELDRRFGGGFDTALSRPADDLDLRPPAGVLLVARLRGRAVGCGALKLPPGEPADLKRMWVAPEARGIGLGRRILRELEARAADAGAAVVRLETNAALTEAIGLYRRSGYREVAAFNDEPYADHWFEKRLARKGGRRR